MPPNSSDSQEPQEPAERSKGAGRSDAAFSGELSRCLIELSIAIHKHAMYPADHPSLGPAAARVTESVDRLLQQRGTLSLGVARDQLIIEGVATDSHNPVLRELAGRLHRHHLGALSFHQGVTPGEILEFLTLIAADPDRGGEPLGLGPRERREQQPHIRLHPVAYDDLRLVDDAGTSEEGDEVRRARTRYAQLWVGLARAAMVRAERSDGDFEEGAEQAAEQVEHDPVAVARAISRHPENDAYDQVIVGYLLQIAEELRSASGADTMQLNQRMGQLVSEMDSATLERLMLMGGDVSQRRQFLMNASQGLKSESVIKLLEAAATMEGEGISDYMLRMLRKLAHHAEQSPGTQSQHAENVLQEQITELIGGWSLKDPNPDAYTIALRGMAAAAPIFVVSRGQLFEAEPKRMVEMALEIDAMGNVVSDAVQQIIEDKEATWLIARMKDNEASALTQSLVGSKEQIVRLLEQILDAELLEPQLLDAIIDLVGSEAIEPMVDALVESESTRVRRLLLDRLVPLGSEVGQVAVSRIDDARWYVTRNMLTILNGLDELPESFKPDGFLRHENHRVRLEALHIMFRMPPLREKGISYGLADSEEKAVRLALAAAMDDCPKTAIPLVISRAIEGPTDLRVAAIRVLGSAGGEAAIATLLRITQPKRALFRWKHPPKTAEYLAALAALCGHRDERRVRPVLNLAARRRDPEIAAVVREPQGSDG